MNLVGIPYTSTKEFYRARYRQRVKDKMCTSCGRDAMPDSIRCGVCQERYNRQKKARQDGLRQEGFCTQCQRPAQNGPWCDACRAKARKADKTRKLRVLSQYGGICECCGEAHEAMLCIDHINGGGNAHRKEIGVGGQKIYKWLVRNGFPPGFRVMCHNCNIGRQINGGICPHKQVKDDQCSQPSS